MKITRRNFMALMAATATVSALTLRGCSSNSTASSSAASSTASSAAASSAAETGTRTVDTDKGPVEIPVNPQVIFSDYYLGEFLAVGVKPVIASPYSLNNPFLADYVDGIEAMNVASAETSLEMIAEAQPDLIVTITEADYEKYSEIAPTVYIQDGQRSDEELFCYIADLVGKSEEADAYIADFNDRVMELQGRDPKHRGRPHCFHRGSLAAANLHHGQPLCPRRQHLVRYVGTESPCQGAGRNGGR